MKAALGWHFPDGELHLLDWMRKANVVVDGRLAYQYRKLEAALAWVRSWDCAIDVGSHIGLHSAHLARRFRKVIAFEPIAAHRACFEKNLEGVDGADIILLPFACGAEAGNVALRSGTPGSSGDTRIVDGAGEMAEMVTIDAMVDPAETVGFIKLDCEGYELFALHGAEKTLRRCKPAIMVEQKPGRAEKYGLPRTAAVDWLIGLGAKLRLEMSGDYILSWD